MSDLLSADDKKMIKHSNCTLQNGVPDLMLSQTFYRQILRLVLMERLTKK